MQRLRAHRIPERCAVRIPSIRETFSAVLMALVLFVLTLFASGYGSGSTSGYGNSYLYGYSFVGLAISCLIAPVVEELIFREALPRLLARRVPAGVAVLASAAAFAAIHMGYGWPAWIALFIGAVLLSVSYSRSQNLSVPILSHCLLNATLSVYSAL